MNIEFSNTEKNIHFIGIGGISMSGLAEILKKRGFQVSGSDIKLSSITDRLQGMGIKIYKGHEKIHVTPDIDLVVYTAAVKGDNPEMLQAKALGIPVMERAVLLGQIMKNYEKAVAVAGTHGKTTTTSMVSHVLMEAGLDPTITVGGILDAIEGNIRIGSSSYFVAESCEYCDSFLSFYPFVAVILNVEEDHLDYFDGIQAIRTSFRRFAALVPDDGAVIINAGIDNYEALVKGLRCQVISYGLVENAFVQGKNIRFNKAGCASFDVYTGGEFTERAQLSVTGLHNVENALATIGAGMFLGIAPDVVCKGIKAYKGIHRRFEKKGEWMGVQVYDDYAHHPTEIKATLEGARQLAYNKLWCVFQPHTYTRTKAFLEEFSDSFANADKVIITDIYAAREQDPGDIHAKDLVKRMQEKNIDVIYEKNFSDVQKFLLKNLTPGDLLITMGAGDVVNIGENLLEENLSTISTAVAHN